MRRQISWLRIALMLAVTGVVGALAGYGGLRLWRDHVSDTSIQPAGEQVAAAAPSAAPTPPTPTPPASGKQPKSPNPSLAGKSPVVTPRTPQPERIVSFSPPDETQEAPEQPEKAAEPPLSMSQPAARPANDATLRPRYSVVLDLARGRQQLALDVGEKDLRVVALQRCSAKYEIKSNTILINGPREITIAVEFNKLSGGKTQITLEPATKDDAGKNMPFTVRSMENVRRQIGQQGERAAAQVAAWKAERDSLDAYLKSAVTTPTRYNAARARLEELKKMIPEADKQVAAMKVSFDTAEKMLELAKSLSEKCVVLLE